MLLEAAMDGFVESLVVMGFDRACVMQAAQKLSDEKVETMYALLILIDANICCSR